MTEGLPSRGRSSGRDEQHGWQMDHRLAMAERLSGNLKPRDFALSGERRRLALARVLRRPLLILMSPPTI